MLPVPPLKVAVPTLFDPSVNVTLPVAIPAPGETGPMVAVTVKGWPNTTLVDEVERVVTVDALPTLIVKADEVLARKYKSPG
jgi:hypothetical protein